MNCETKHTKEVGTEAILIPAVVVAVWLILSHMRKLQFIKEYMELQKKALEKEVALPGDIKEVVRAKPDWAAVTLRLGIISLILGILENGVLYFQRTWPKYRMIPLTGTFFSLDGLDNFRAEFTVKGVKAVELVGFYDNYQIEKN